MQRPVPRRHRRLQRSRVVKKLVPQILLGLDRLCLLLLGNYGSLW